MSSSDPVAALLFDPDDGVLRLAHGTLSVLALLAADPVDPRLHDHDVAPHVAALRRAGVLGRGGVHAAVRPLTDAIAAATTTLDLAVADRQQARRCHGWISEDLVVVAVPAPDQPHAFDLVADRPEALPSLVDDLVGLPAGAGAAPDARALRVDGDEFEALVAAGGAPAATGGPAASGDENAAATVAAVAAALTARWALRVRRGDEPERVLAVLDAGATGLWREELDGEALRLSPTDSVQVHAAIARLLARD